MRIFLLISLIFITISGFGWGFFAHRKINHYAVFLLPPEMLGLYKANIDRISEESVTPDRRRYVDDEEAPRHFIDIEHYQAHSLDSIPWSYESVKSTYPQDSIRYYGILPWHLIESTRQLSNAFRAQDRVRIIDLSAHIGHYIADAHVPLHTTINYNGQLTGQKGIHALWESKLPELFFQDYDLLIGKAEYIEDIPLKVWQTISSSHAAVDSVLLLEKLVSDRMPEDKKYTHEERGTTYIKQPSLEFSRKYHDALDGMVERQIRKAIKMTADIWYTTWVNAGKPELLPRSESIIEEKKEQRDDLHIDCEHH